MGSWDDWLTFHPFHFSDGPVLSVEVRGSSGSFFHGKLQGRSLTESLRKLGSVEARFP